MVNLELYRIFVIVANEGNISKASEILHISQPADMVPPRTAH